MYRGMFSDAWKVFVPITLVVGGAIFGAGVLVGYHLR